jgi:uroporphyrin-III C-methyltransferase/precorrin-2 dehydrogenase/sirohydrochlorin ferrochelatase
MGRTVAASVSERLMDAGLSRDTTVAVIENASRTDRKLFHGVLCELSSLEARDDLDGPVMVIIGEAVAGANFDKSEPLSAFRKSVRSHEYADQEQGQEKGMQQ